MTSGVHRPKQTMFGPAATATYWLPRTVNVMGEAFMRMLVGNCQSVLPSRWSTAAKPALLVCTATFPDTWAGRILESPILRWIGRLSYSIYIWQQLAMFAESDPHSPLPALQHFPLNILVILVCATLSHYGVEKPLIRRARNWGKEIAAPLRPRAAI
jgi:peptidoglycan/LPS O-acetylase OafA/YrhL